MKKKKSMNQTQLLDCPRQVLSPMVLKQLIFTVLFCFFLRIADIKASTSDSTKTSSPSLMLGLGNDTYYGSYFYGVGLFNYKKKITPAIFMISRSFQAGAGIRYAPSKNLSIIPVIGIVNGKSLSGGPNSVVADGGSLVLLCNYEDQRFYFDEGSLFYKSIRKTGPITTDYLWYWLTAGIKLNKYITGGIHFEHLLKTRTSDNHAGSLYRYIGPYIQGNLPWLSYIRLTTGFQEKHTELIRISLVTYLK